MRNAADLLSGRPASLEREPKDGWIRAEPHRIGNGTRKALYALIRVMCPPPPAPQLPNLEERLERAICQLMPYFPPLIRFAFALLVRIVEWSPVWRFKAMRRLRSMDRDAAEALLNEMCLSPSPLVRVIVMGVRNLILVAYYDLDEVHAVIGYDAIPWFKNRIALRQRLLAGEPARPEDRIGPHSKAVTP